MLTMELSYYDATTGQRRIKRRYKWAMFAFIAGFGFGLIAGMMIHDL